MTQRCVSKIAREALSCNACFENSELRRVGVQLPQPRWVGPKYWSAPQRVVAVLINPGGGTRADPQQRDASRNRLLEFKAGRATLNDVFELQEEQMPAWGRQRMLPFYTSALGLDLNEIAFANIAWCATAGNRYPCTMLRDCFRLHTGPLLKALAPHVVLLSGKPAQRFADPIRTFLPKARIIPMLHYAHREGADVERDRLAMVLRQLVQRRLRG